MSLRFEEAIDAVVKKIRLSMSSKRRKGFLSDTSCLANWLDEALRGRGSMFAGCLGNLAETASYIRGTLMDMPNDFSCYLHMELPFQFRAFLHRDGNIYLVSDCKNKVTVSRLVSTSMLQKCLREDLHSLMSMIPVVKCKSGRIYKLCYHSANIPISAHSIVATQLNPKTEDPLETCIAFEFLLTIKMPLTSHQLPPCLEKAQPNMNYWLALPISHYDVDFNSSSYLACSHNWQFINGQRRQQARTLVRLLYALSVRNDTLQTIGSHILKHTCINRFEFCGLDYADRPFSSRVIDMMLMHGTSKLEALNMTFNQGRLVRLETNPALQSDCVKADVVRRLMKDHKDIVSPMKLYEMFWLFGFDDIKPPPQFGNQRRRQKNNKKAA